MTKIEQLLWKLRRIGNKHSVAELCTCSDPHIDPRVAFHEEGCLYRVLADAREVLAEEVDRELNIREKLTSDI